MPSLQSLRRKIGAIKNTQKITKAMKMVAAAKLRRAQQRILAYRPYGVRMRGVIADLSARVNRDAHPLLQKCPVRTIQVPWSQVTVDCAGPSMRMFFARPCRSSETVRHEAPKK